ncbi:glycolate oxidase subunit GlcE [Maritimibacter dapengensis]|uniref:Glycolate oxidase subunit GlcE n=1 Tax=Maritimibacter dapengensis TaxID=2836868 RepID=A0ABS6SYA4_9RHOB|nr:glycolate oxidase subunit GlcE [Maritimibacter dapengensis]MBV7377937.1 glycolate oxidase subunit GlcE [Maritimibacter dapengensis]
MKATSEAELAEAIGGATGPLRIMGGGTRDVGRPVAGEVLEVGLTGVELYEPGSLTLVVRAGTPLAEIEKLLANEGQRLAFEPLDFRGFLQPGDRHASAVSTIGGVVAANASGPRRIQAGAVRDFTLGMRFVDGTGRIVKNGGRVMKNVTGYDLVKLVAGSWGTLGVISEISLKVQSIPETEATLVGHCDSVDDAVARMSAALGSPFDVTGACADLRGRVSIRLEGLEGSVDYRARALSSGALQGFERVDAETSREIWRGVTSLEAFQSTPATDVWRISLRPSDTPAFMDAVEDIAANAVFDWGGGLVWLETKEGLVTQDAAGLIRDTANRFGGHATLMRASASARAALDVFQPQAPGLARLSAAIKQKFDPRGILNPGLMGY